MKISVFVKPRSKLESVEPQVDGTFIVRVHAPPVEGEANEQVCRLLAQHFNVAKSQVQLISGLKSKKKIFEIRVCPHLIASSLSHKNVQT